MRAAKLTASGNIGRCSATSAPTLRSCVSTLLGLAASLRAIEGIGSQSLSWPWFHTELLCKASPGTTGYYIAYHQNVSWVPLSACGGGWELAASTRAPKSILSNTSIGYKPRARRSCDRTLARGRGVESQVDSCHCMQCGALGADGAVGTTSSYVRVFPNCRITKANSINVAPHAQGNRAL